jgi:hypothetical protein
MFKGNNSPRNHELEDVTFRMMRIQGLGAGVYAYFQYSLRETRSPQVIKKVFPVAKVTFSLNPETSNQLSII